MRRSSILGALVLCALALGGFAVANASAAELTAVTCESVAAGTGNYKTSACETPKVAASNFETKALPVDQTTEVTGEAVGKTVLRGVVAFLNVEITCAKTGGTGHVTNREPEVGKHAIEGSKIFIDYTECHASLQSDTTKKCKVESISGTKEIKGTIATNELKSTTLIDHMMEHTVPTDHYIKTEPVIGNFIEFWILAEGVEGSECKIPKTKVTVTGSILGVADTSKHNHVTFTPATNGGLIKANGAAASFEGTTTGVMKGTTNLVGAQTFTPEG